MWSRPPFTALLRPQQKQLFMLGAAVLHLVPALIIGMQWQDFRLSAASLPREQVLQVDLLSLATSKNSLSLFPAEGAALSQQGQSVSASVPASSTLASDREGDPVSREGQNEESVPPAALPTFPLPYLSVHELDERPWADVPVLIPFPETDWKGGRIKGVLELFIGEDGSVDRILVGDSTLPEEFETAAMGAFRQVKMRPGMKEGKPVRSIMKILVEFEQQ